MTNHHDGLPADDDMKERIEAQQPVTRSGAEQRAVEYAALYPGQAFSVIYVNARGSKQRHSGWYVIHAGSTEEEFGEVQPW